MRAFGLIAGAGLVLAAGLAGCATTANRGEPGQVVIESEPMGALVHAADGRECETPCVFTLDAPLSVTIAKAGFEEVRRTIKPSKSRPILVREKLKLAAPTVGVEEEKLPDL